jgi:hypothetical protein
MHHGRLIALAIRLNQNDAVPSGLLFIVRVRKTENEHEIGAASIPDHDLASIENPLVTLRDRGGGAGARVAPRIRLCYGKAHRMALPSGISGRSIFFCFSVPYIILTMKDINNLWNIY